MFKMNKQEPQSSTLLSFNPDDDPASTLKSFNEFIQLFELCYDSVYPDPPKVSLDAALQQWKIENTSDEVPDPKPTMIQYDTVRNQWQSQDKVAKFLGIFSSPRFQADWLISLPNEGNRKVATWDVFVTAIRQYYKPTENLTLKNFHFRELTQNEGEAFSAFCNRVVKEAQHCSFNCQSPDCNASEIAIRDQIVIGTTQSKIKDEALMKSWNLEALRKEGMKIESAGRGGAEISGEQANKTGRYTYRNIRKSKEKTKFSCFYCRYVIHDSINEHRVKCPAKNHTCKGCSKMGHFVSVCRNGKQVGHIDPEKEDEYATQNEDEEVYNIHIFRVKASNHSVKPKLISMINQKKNFKVQVIIDNSLDTVLADTGAHVSVCGTV